MVNAELGTTWGEKKYFYLEVFEVPLSKTYGIKKQRFKVLSVFDSYYVD